MPTIRKPIEALRPEHCHHPYLAFEKLINDSTIKGDAKQKHQATALQGSLPDPLREAYTRAFNRRYKALEGFQGGVDGAVTRCFQVKVSGRLAAGLGNASVLENGLSLNHTYGLPYLPGTGLKGMASAMAHLGLSGSSWRRGVEKDGTWMGQGEDHKVLFGTMDTGAEDAAAGIVIFHDAWWDPEPAPGMPETQLPFQPDVMTPHHMEYNLEGKDWPNDWESPVPVPYLTTGGTFRLALTGPEEWVEAAFEILRMAFQHLGFGAKTQIGYGRGDLIEHLSEEKKAQRLVRDAERAAAAEALRRQREAQEAQARDERRRAAQEISEGKLVPTDPGRGLYSLVFGDRTLSNQRRDDLKTLAAEAWQSIADDARKRGPRGGRVLVTFCIENGQPVLLGLAPNIPAN